MDLGLQDKVAIITGGSDGIGLAAALSMAGEGARVAIIARDQGRLDSGFSVPATLFNAASHCTSSIM